MNLSTAGSLDMKFILDLYMESFPKEERKPFSVIQRKAAMGTMEILVITEGKKRIGLAITASEGDLVLLDYFAISKSCQGRGSGSEALFLLKELYSGKQFFLEIERPDEGAANAGERVRRKNFYLKNGMLETGIHVTLFGVPMELLAARPGLTFGECERLYRELLGPLYHNVVYEETEN